MNRLPSVVLLSGVLLAQQSLAQPPENKCTAPLHKAISGYMECKLKASSGVTGANDVKCDTRFSKLARSILGNAKICAVPPPFSADAVIQKASESITSSVSQIRSLDQGLVGGNATGTLTVKIVNSLPTSSPCMDGGNSLTVFTKNGPASGTQIAAGQSQIFSDNFTSFPGAGIQINNWYWTQSPYPVEQFGPQNPDNSGAQFWFSDASCSSLQQQGPVFGDGIQTFLVSSVKGSNTGGSCTITVTPNAYTDAVTPGCCSWSTCSGPWGITNNPKQKWPPPTLNAKELP